jgi:hypothetical protein
MIAPKYLLVAGLFAALFVPAAAGGEAATPETTIVSGPAAYANVTAATFSFTSNQPAKFACALDQGAFFTCKSPYTVRVGDGKHQFSVVAVAHGRSDPTPADRPWTVDTVAPKPVKERLVVRYGRLEIRWGALGSVGVQRVVVLRSTNPTRAPARQVYSGIGTAYVDPGFRNAYFHQYRIVATDRAGNQSQPVDVVVGQDELLLTPTYGTRVRGAVKLHWRAARHASFYNLQLFRGKKKVLSTWPRAAALKLGRSWTYGGHRYVLKPGLYTWDVWPGFGSAGSSHYGRLLGQSSFVV